MSRRPEHPYDYVAYLAARAIEGSPRSIRSQQIAIRMAVDAFLVGLDEVPGSDHTGVFADADNALAHLIKELR